ncbi:hypothetical protein BU16DRAFT_567211 [Lophium mytilinum]|uniref:Uncharacterized protein n=1 Tax=Lophium mytilinum TaxID=390894 RepID=A0A6A6QDM4_9PEZI|nr:hypothetical protein BU16DRAFT_567211 [Lophium mytilinum]
MEDNPNTSVQSTLIMTPSSTVIGEANEYLRTSECNACIRLVEHLDLIMSRLPALIEGESTLKKSEKLQLAFVFQVIVKHAWEITDPSSISLIGTSTACGRTRFKVVHTEGGVLQELVQGGETCRLLELSALLDKTEAILFKLSQGFHRKRNNHPKTLHTQPRTTNPTNQPAMASTVPALTTPSKAAPTRTTAFSSSDSSPDPMLHRLLAMLAIESILSVEQQLQIALNLQTLIKHIWKDVDPRSISLIMVSSGDKKYRLQIVRTDCHRLEVLAQGGAVSERRFALGALRNAVEELLADLSG